MTKKLFLAGLFFFLASVTMAQSLQLYPTLGGAGSAVVPRGSDVAMIRFYLRAVNGAASFSGIRVRNQSPHVQFGSGFGISRIRIYRNSDSGASFPDLGATPLVDRPLTAGASDTQGISGFTDSIASGNIRGYTLVYSIEDDAALSSPSDPSVSTTVNATIMTIEDSSGQPVSLVGGTIISTPVLSGYKTLRVSSLLPSRVVPGQLRVPALFVSVMPLGEAVQNIQLKFRNDAANFVSNNATTGIKRAYLVLAESSLLNSDGTPIYGAIEAFLDPGSNPLILADTNLGTGVFVSKSEVEFSIPSDVLDKFPATQTKNVMLVYEVGENFIVASDTVIKAQLASISGQGESSGLIIKQVQALPSSPADSDVAGLGYASPSRILLDGLAGPGSTVPLFQIALIAYRSPITLQQLHLKNPILDLNQISKTVPYITQPSELGGIKKIKLYTDGGIPNGTFDGINSQDTLIGELALGLGQNDAQNAYVPITFPDGFDIPVFNSNQSNTLLDGRKMIYVVYELGTGVTGETMTAQLADATGIAHVDNVTTKNIALSGVKPVVTTPAAQVTIYKTNVLLEDVQNIAPSPNLVVQGQIKVPMLAIRLKVINQFPSASFQIKNESDTFLMDGKGVNKVWLYRDELPYQVFDSQDVFLSSNDRLSQVRQVSLGGVRLDTGTEKRFLILYDMGQNATVSSSGSNSTIRSQLVGITGQASGSTLLMSGEPNTPKIPAGLRVASKPLLVNFSDANLNPSTLDTQQQSVNLNIENISDTPIQITKSGLRFYYGGPDGPDVSYQFLVTPLTDTTSNIAAHQSSVSSWHFKLEKSEYQGSIYMDAYVQYQTASGAKAVLSRYSNSLNGDSWIYAVPVPLAMTVLTKKPTYSWSIPQYIESMSVLSGTVEVPFSNGGAIPVGGSVKIQFRDKGRTIEPTGFVVKLNAITLPYVENPSGAPSYKYDSANGVLMLSNVGTVDGRFSLQVRDLEGVYLAPATVSFVMSSDKVRIENFLVYPSPYKAGTTFLMGFNLTLKATVTFYVYNHLGILVWKESRFFDQPGYQLLASRSDSSLVMPSNTNTTFINPLANILSMGLYICRAVAQDENGHTVSATTRFSVY